MNTKKNHSWQLPVLLIWIVALAAISGCSKKSEPGPDTTGKVAIANLTDEQQITKMIEDALYRLRHGDKSALYELEFPYRRDETNFDRYLAMRAILWANIDTLVQINVDSVKLLEKDSGFVWINMVFVGERGDTSRMDDRLVVNKYGGRWIKPTTSTLKAQNEYADLVRKSDSAAEAEARGE